MLSMKWGQKRILQCVEFLYLLILFFGVWRNDPFGEPETNIAVSANNGAAEKPKIAITFDDGPNEYCTEELLDGLKERNVKATFFLIGQNIEKENNRELVKRIYEDGHLLGNHTYHHVEITRISDEEAYQELKMTNDLVYEILGIEMDYMRPPFGSWQKELEEKMNILPVLWTIDPLDWTTENVDEIVNKVVTKAEENDIILMHDCYKSSVEAALRIIDLLQAEGYEFVTVEELIMT